MDIEERIRLLTRELESRFGKRDEPRFFRAPGRVDLMGSHTDYNEGFILASSVDRDIIAAARPRSGGVVNLYSLNTGLEVRVHVDHLKNDPEHGWANYAKGVINELIELKAPFTGMDLVVHGEVPVGGNLSSSAALEAAVCEAALGTMEFEIAEWEKVQLCWRAETVFVGLPCGIMDQFTVFMGDEDVALHLDCRSLEFDKIRFDGNKACLMVIDSGLGRELVASKYAERVGECKEAVRILKRANKKIRALRDADMEDLEAVKDELGPVLFRRARHVVSENRRVTEAASAAGKGDMKTLGRIMEECYKSCRDDYENSAPELDRLHDLVTGLPDVLGVRICGAGWGGCLLALAESAEADRLESSIPERYNRETGRKGRAWKVMASAGAGPLS